MSLTHSNISIAPMMDWSDRHFRYFMRLLHPSAVLYTEMLTSGAVVHGDREKLLSFNKEEHPVVLQLGGSEPNELAEAAKIGESFGYDEINLNVGCPSDRVQSGAFGACLMKTPEIVAECVATMRDAVKIPVTVKTRLGVDELDSEDFFFSFIETVKHSGCTHFIIHARKAWLKGLSPKQNRTVPPLRYDRVYKLKENYPDLRIDINGGINTVDAINEHLKHVDGVMLGRVAYQDPYVLMRLCNNPLTRVDIIYHYCKYVEHELEKGVPLSRLVHPIFALFKGQPGANAWRRYLSEHAHKRGAGVNTIEKALSFFNRPCGIDLF